MVPTHYYLILGAALFTIGVIGVLTRRNAGLLHSREMVLVQGRLENRDDLVTFLQALPEERIENLVLLIPGIKECANVPYARKGLTT